jgi:hypothetical protein
MAGQAATRKGLEHYRAMGGALLKVKEQLKRGQWMKWLNGGTLLFSPRQAYRYMALAKFAVTANLEEQWRTILGNGPAPSGAGGEPAAKPSPATASRNPGGTPSGDHTKTFNLRLTTASYDQFVEMANGLMKKFGLDNQHDAIFEAVRRCFGEEA